MMYAERRDSFSLAPSCWYVISLLSPVRTVKKYQVLRGLSTIAELLVYDIGNIPSFLYADVIYWTV